MDAWERHLCKRKCHILVWVTSDMLDAALALAILASDVPAYLHIPSFFCLAGMSKSLRQENLHIA
jgi:hypothetical protein